MQNTSHISFLTESLKKIRTIAPVTTMIKLR